MSSEKVFKTLDEQIEILKNKGLIIDDIEHAKDVLLRENYFFVSGYRHLFMQNNKPNKFIPGTTFDELYAMFYFDRSMRNIFFKHILIIENNIKSLISYEMSKKYGFKEKDYLNVDNFTQNPMKVRQVHDILDKMRRQIRVNGKQHTATLHYMSNYGYIPLWILVKVLSFGIVSELYTILKEEDQNSISNFYKIDPSTLSIYLAVLSNYRNLCAHEDILYEHHTQRSIPDNQYHEKLNISKSTDEQEYLYGKNDLFAVVIILKIMLTDKEFRNFINEVSYELDFLEGRINSITRDSVLKNIGFPSNWREIID